MFRRVAVVVIALASAGCASRGPIVEARQEGPLKAAAFQISGSAEELAPAERLAAQALVQRGLRRAEPGEAAEYAVQVSYAERPRTVGAFVPRQEGGPSWLAHEKARWSLATRVTTVGVRIAETGSGQEAYAARASEAHRQAAAADLPVLIEAALAPLQAEP